MMIDVLSEIGIAGWTAIGTGTVAVVWGTVELRGRKIWAPKSLEGDVNNIGDKVRGHDTEISILQQENAHQNELLRESVVKPLARITGQMDEMMTRQGKQGESIAGMEQGQKGLAHSVDDLRDQVKAIRDR